MGTDGDDLTGDNANLSTRINHVAYRGRRMLYTRGTRTDSDSTLLVVGMWGYGCALKIPKLSVGVSRAKHVYRSPQCTVSEALA